MRNQGWRQEPCGHHDHKQAGQNAGCRKGAPLQDIALRVELVEVRAHVGHEAEQVGVREPTPKDELDDLFNTGKDRDWAIIGAGVTLPTSSPTRRSGDMQM